VSGIDPKLDCFQDWQSRQVVEDVTLDFPEIVDVKRSVSIIDGDAGDDLFDGGVDVLVGEVFKCVEGISENQHVQIVENG